MPVPPMGLGHPTGVWSGRATLVESRSWKVCHGSQVAMTAEAGRSPSLVSTAVTRPLRTSMRLTGQPRWTRDFAQLEVGRKSLDQD